MKKFIQNISYYIGCLLIGLARFITILRSSLFILLAISIVMGVLMITMIGLFDLITPELNTLGKTYWDVIVVILGGATMWFGFTKMFEGNNEPEKSKRY